MDSSALDEQRQLELQHGQQEQEHEQEDQREIDLYCESCTPQMYIDDLERSGRGVDNADLSLFHAVVARRVEVVQFMLDKRCDKDVLRDVNGGLTPLHVAAWSGQMAMTQALIAHGADIDIRCHRGMSALDRAADGGYADIARMIIEHGADVNIGGEGGKTPLHAASERDEVECMLLLLAKGAALDVLDDQGLSPLALAATNGHDS